MSAEPSAADWEALKATARALPEDVRRAAAQEWSRSAQLEHASIASFARFSLELLAVAAPPALLEAAHHAGLDELRHARLTFGLASAYAGAALGPGPLPLDARAFDGLDLQRSACNAVVEGCIGETLAAVEAGHAAGLAQPAAVRTVLQTIARDESQHAALAFRFAAWAIARGGPALTAAVQQAAHAQLDAIDAEPLPAPSLDLGAHGRLSPAQRLAFRRQAIAAVLRPALNRLFAGLHSEPELRVNPEP